MLLQCHPLNPLRPPDWRWERARLIREKNIRLRKEEHDKWVLKASQFQMNLHECADDTDRFDLMSQTPEIYTAYLIYTQGEETGRQPVRYSIEARLLARQSAYEISKLTGISDKVIELYERLFFNVIDRLDQYDYIVNYVLGPSIHSGVTDRDYDLMWKLFGYCYGPKVLDMMIYTTTSLDRKPSTAEEVTACMDADIRDAIRRRTMIITRIFSVNSFSQKDMLDIYHKLQEIERVSSKRGGDDFVLNYAQIMLQSLPWKPTSQTAIAADSTAKYDVRNAELRTDELLSIAFDPTSSPAEPVEGITYPEPRHVKKVQQG